MKDVRLYLIHILECIERIQEYTHGGWTEFQSSHLIQDAVVRNLQILSESTQRISPQLKATHPDVDWPAIARFRNVMVHDYFGIRHELIWGIVVQHLSDLKRNVSAMLSPDKDVPDAGR